MQKKVEREIEKRRENAFLLISDLLIFTLSMIFARCHFAFGAYPLAISFIAVLKSGVFIATAGALVGAISLGNTGFIYAVISLVTLFLRIIISGGTRGEKKLFFESLTLKTATALVSSLIGAMYRILLDGFSLESLLFALFALALSSGFTVLFSGIYIGDVQLFDVLLSKKTLLSRTAFKSDKEKLSHAMFTGSLLVFIYAVGISLKAYEFFGISLGYVYSAFITLFVAKRFGTARAVAVGFISSVSLNGVYAVSFAFAGLGAGIFFVFGTAYAIIGALALLLLYTYYVGGLTGVVSTLPEFVLASSIFLPFANRLSKEKEEIVGVKERDVSQRMVNVASLSHKNFGTRSAHLNALSSIKNISRVLSLGGKNEGNPVYSDYRDSVLISIREHCTACPDFESCAAQCPAPCAENIDLIAEKLTNKERLFCEDINLFPKYCAHKESLYEKVIFDAQSLESFKKKNRRLDMISKNYELIYRALDEDFIKNEEELSLNQTESERIEKILSNAGVSEPSCKIFGKRKRHIIYAGLDRGGKISTSRELISSIEDALGIKLSEGKFYKKDDYILSEFDEVEKYGPSLAVSTCTKPGEEASGDSIASFKSNDGKYYVMLSDGEGSGREARATSSLACDYLCGTLGFSVSKATAISSLNHVLKNREIEKSATVDLFELDLYTGEAVFYKCGAAASYIKRANSIFKVRTQSTPIGLMSKVDAESIRVDVKHGDFVILLSDGVLAENDDVTWFLELINRESVGDIKKYADMLLDKARARGGEISDDMSVAVIKISLAS
jgi:stage II sporulation protein E